MKDPKTYRQEVYEVWLYQHPECTWGTARWQERKNTNAPSSLISTINSLPSERQ